MSVYENLVPPNLDKICNNTTTQQTALGITTTNGTETCSNPLSYYIGYSFDIVIILLASLLIIKILAWKK